MKKLSLLYIFVGLMFCNTAFVECIKGDCTNGYGTYTHADGRVKKVRFKKGILVEKEVTGREKTVQQNY